MKKIEAKNKKITIIPDVHQMCGWVDLILEKEKDSNHFVFLGDWFDTFRQPDGGMCFGFSQTCIWLNERFEELGDKATWLLGNHDCAYMASYKPGSYKIRNTKYFCSGWTKTKAQQFNKEIDQKWVSAQKLCCMVGDYVCVHAGFHKDQFKPFLSEEENINLMYDNWEKDKEKFMIIPDHWIWYVSSLRRGPDPYSSPIWLDWSEFEPMEDIIQIVGHSSRSNYEIKGHKPRSFNFCIDCNQSIYMNLEDGVVNINSVK